MDEKTSLGMPIPMMLLLLRNWGYCGMREGDDPPPEYEGDDAPLAYDDGADPAAGYTLGRGLDCGLGRGDV